MFTNRKSEHYNIVKVITTLLVVYAHSTRMYTGLGVVQPANSSLFLSQITTLIYSFHMPLFMALSGMIYGTCIERGKYSDTVNFIKNKFKRLIIPYFIWGFLYVAPVMVQWQFTDLSYLEYCYTGIVLGCGARHLWYLAVLFEIFFVVAFLRKFLKANTIALFIEGCIFLTLCFFSEEFTMCFQIQNFCYYLFYFYMGYLFNKNYDFVMGKFTKPTFAIVTLIVFIFSYEYRAYKLLSITSALSGSLFALILTSFIPPHLMKNKIMQKANSNGFGIYLWHPMIIYVLYYYCGNLSFNPVLLSGIIAAIAYLLSWFLTEVIKRANLGMIIGEYKRL